mgnify:CR=1 FL=1|tara:strand:- start:841 stop:1062 length:222 start_codon:yes stop_codon:yes gene_type:complete
MYTVAAVAVAAVAAGLFGSTEQSRCLRLARQNNHLAPFGFAEQSRRRFVLCSRTILCGAAEQSRRTTGVLGYR